MVKSIFLYLLLPCSLLLCATEAMGQQGKAKASPKKVDTLFTVTNVTGQVTLNAKPLKPGCNNTAICVGSVRKSKIPSIQMGNNSYLELTGPGGKQILYGAADNCTQPPCQPVAKVALVNKGPKKEFLLGTQAEFDQIMTTFNQNVLDKQQQLQLDKQQLQLEKAKAPQQQKAPQKVNNKAKAGGGR